jgi:hypothetical protein
LEYEHEGSEHTVRNYVFVKDYESLVCMYMVLEILEIVLVGYWNMLKFKEVCYDMVVMKFESLSKWQFNNVAGRPGE